jgi:hypothetical protein
MRERTSVKIARFVPGREGKSNLSFQFNKDDIKKAQLIKYIEACKKAKREYNKSQFGK